MIYLVQHGEAQSKEENPDRPLTDQGAQHAQDLGDFLARAGIRVSTVFHSGKLRARQTAEILAEYLAPGDNVEQMDGLGPKDPAEPMREHLAAQEQDVMVVSHLPFVAHLAAALAGGREDEPAVAFTPGTVVALEPGDGHARIAWMIRPELLH